MVNSRKSPALVAPAQRKWLGASTYPERLHRAALAHSWHCPETSRTSCCSAHHPRACLIPLASRVAYLEPILSLCLIF